MTNPIGGHSAHVAARPADATRNTSAKPKGGTVFDMQQKSVIFERPKPNVIEQAQAHARAVERQVERGFADTWKAANYTRQAIADVAKAAKTPLSQPEGGGGGGAQPDAASADGMNISYSNGPVGPAENDYGRYDGLGINQSQGPVGPAAGEQEED